MRKKPVFLLLGALLVFAGLFSCSEFVLPKNVEVEGTLDFPVRIGKSDWGIALASALEEAFGGNVSRGDLDLDIKVYHVNYSSSQTEQAFLIYVHSEMTNPLNPDDYLKEVAEFLYKKGTEEDYEISEELDLSALGKIEFSKDISIPTLGSSGTLSAAVHRNISLSETIPLGTLFDDGFLHASILDGEFIVEMEVLQGSAPLGSDIVEKTYDVVLQQNPDSSSGTAFQGLNCSSSSLANQDLNCNDIQINGDLDFEFKPGFTLTGESLTLKLTITPKITKLGGLDWRFTNTIRQNLNHQINPLDLKEPAKYINYIVYEDHDGDATTKPTAGIGILFNFTEMVDGLELAMKCTALGINKTAALTAGENIIFGNTSAGTMWLNGDYPDPPLPAPFGGAQLEELDFELEVRPKNGGDVLSIDFGIAGFEPGILDIEGKAVFFQNWTEAQINMESAIKAAQSLDEEAFKGQIPAEGEKPIDLSMLGDYIPGFTFNEDSVQAKIFLAGPHQAIVDESPRLSFVAVYGENDSEKICDGELVLDENVVSISNDIVDESYTKKQLPEGGITFDFLTIINHQPDNLFFTYEITLPPVLNVKPEMFQSILDGDSGESSTVNSNITVTIMALLSMQLNGPGTIAFPGMFEDAGDLFGRDKPGALFEGVNVQYVRVTLDFIDPFFIGGHLFVEKFDDTEADYKDKMIFPDGIGLNGKKITLNVANDTLKTMETNLIYPDVKVSFDQGGTIRIPKKMGIAGIKFEIKGSAKVGEFFE